MAKRIATTRADSRGDAALWEALRFLYCDRRVAAGQGDAVRLVDERHRLDAAGLPAGEQVDGLCAFAIDVLGAPAAAVRAHVARARARAGDGGIGAVARTDRLRRRLAAGGAG